MATSGGGFAASGLLQGFAQSYNAAYQRRTQQDLDQRHQLGSTLLALYPNARPEAQQDIAQRLLQIYSTPVGKKLDKKLGDVSTLGQATAQQGMEQGAQAGTAGAQAQTQAAQGQINQQGAQPAAQLPAPPSGVFQGAPVAAPPMAGATGAIPLSQPGIPAPPAYSPLLSPEERNQQAAATITATKSAEMTAELDARRKAADAAGLKPGTPGYENFIAGRMVSPYAHLQSKAIVGPNGERQIVNFNPLAGTYSDMEGNEIENPVMWSAAVNAPGTSAYKTFYAAGKQSGLTDKEISDNWNTQNSTQHGFKMVPQPDGSIQMVPVTTTTSKTRGGIPTPPGGGAGGGAAAAGGAGRVVGGKIPPEVDKAQTSYQDSITRFNVMSETLPKALQGNQQAMINLLYNHIGMTVGLQKGARITQDIINEAQQSAPWMSTLLARIGVGNGFEMTPELLRGVTLAPDQMRQMVDLAEGRVEQDYRKFQEEQSFYRGGAPQTPQDVIAGGRAKQKGLPAPPATPKTAPGAMPPASAAPAAASSNNPLGI
jgi:hypothetical protein